MSRSPRRIILIAAAVLAGAAVAGAAGAAGGFVIGRHWPVTQITRVLEAAWVMPSSRVWHEFARTDLPRYETARVVIDGTLYMLGGFWTADPKATTRVDALDLTSGQWRRLKDMPVALTHANAARAQGSVWLAGGFEGDHPGPVTARVWRWNHAADSWSEGPPLPAPRGGGALVSVGDTLHYFGGFMTDRNTDAADHWQLEPGAAAWQPLAPLPTPRGHLTGIVLDGLIYAISGNRGHDPIPIDVAATERYDPAADRWETITAPPYPLSHNEGSTFAYGGRIVTIGGRALSAGRENQDDVMAFAPASGRWSHLGHIPRRLLGAVAFAHGDAAFAGFGAINNNNPTNPRLWRSELRDAWRLAEALPLDLGEVAAGIIGNSMYVVGEGSPRMIRYDLATATTEVLDSVRPAFGHHHAAEVVDGRLWLVGGLGTAAGLVQIFDPATQQWTFAPPMPFAAGSSASAAISGKIYVAGGIVDRRTTGAAAVFDPAAGAWRTIAPMPRPRNHTASATDGERLYVFGGRGPGSGDDNVVANGFDDVQIYDPASDTWRVSDGTAGAPQPLPQARGGMGKAVWLGGEFWLLGGETEDGPGATRRGVYGRVDIYNPRTNRWRAGPPMRTPRHGIFPLPHDGQIVVAGGGVRAGASRTHIVEAIWPRLDRP